MVQASLVFLGALALLLFGLGLYLMVSGVWLIINSGSDDNDRF
jgi:hypothetical protein